MKHRTHKHVLTRGMSMIEVVIAMGISVLILVTLVSGIVSSLRNIQFARNKSLASHFAQEAIEAVRTVRDDDWNLINNGTYGLLWSGTTWSLNGSSDVLDNRFTRTVVIADGPSPNSKTITVTISWNETGTTKSTILYTTLAKLE